MQTVTSIQSMREWARDKRRSGASIGFVPTMGYLHDGHLSLMERARRENDFVTASIFVNPTQFGPNEDLDRYPRDLAGDSRKCSDVGVDVLFIPEAGHVYGPTHQTYVEVAKVSLPLCGAFRPGHFRGVATVVLKLFNIIGPQKAYFGTKDFQQVRVIRTMVQDLDLDVEIVPCPTVREPDGLAMSSRNAYLSENERKQAAALHQGLLQAKRLFEAREPVPTKYLDALTTRILTERAAEIDYVKFVDPETLEDLGQVKDRALAVLAVRIGKTRLIDNMLFER
ncbi:MAG: pantoate--beta-alanine ligase [Pseudomonadota bacterium]